MDLVAGAKRVIVAMQHTDKEGNSKLRKECTLPLTGKKCIHKVVSDLGVFDVTSRGFVLLERASDVSVEHIQKHTEGHLEISPEVKVIPV
jgi:3-oxoacid CoA-transferase B subunit